MMTPTAIPLARRVAAAIVLAATVILPAVAHGQTWTGVLSGHGAVPANESRARSTVTLTLTGPTLLVQVQWQDLERYPQSFLLYTSAPRYAADRSGVALGLREFSPTQSGTHSERINLAETSAYMASFMRTHGGNVAAARAALVAALDSGYFAIVTQPGATIEIGASLAKVRPARSAGSRPSR